MSVPVLTGWMVVAVPLVTADGMVPRAHPRTHKPEVVVHGAHLQKHGMIQALPELEDELRSVVPTVLRAAENVFTVERVEVHHVEPARVHGLRLARRDFGQQCRVGVRSEMAEALFEVVDLRARRMRRGAGFKDALARTRDPLALLGAELPAEQIRALELEVMARIDDAFLRASADPFPSLALDPETRKIGSL